MAASSLRVEYSATTTNSSGLRIWLVPGLRHAAQRARLGLHRTHARHLQSQLLALGRWQQDWEVQPHHKFEVNLGYMRPYLKNKGTTTN